MQPHSMCTVALLNYYWNQYNVQLPSECTARVEYRDKHGMYKLNQYRLYNIKGNYAKTELSVTILRDGGGLSCTMHADRSSNSEGSLVRMRHDTVHVAGLVEEFKLWRTGVKNGRHHNSRMYGAFEGDINPNIPTILKLDCDLRVPNGFTTVRYELELDRFSYG